MSFIQYNKVVFHWEELNNFMYAVVVVAVVVIVVVVVVVVAIVVAPLQLRFVPLFSLNIYFLAKFAFIQIHTSLYTAYKIIHGHIYIFSYTLIALQKPKEQPSFKENVLILKSTLTTMIVILNTILNNKHTGPHSHFIHIYTHSVARRGSFVCAIQYTCTYNTNNNNNNTCI